MPIYTSSCNLLLAIIIIITHANKLMWFQAMKAASPSFEPVSMDSEDKLFIMFTSGTSGIPRSISHSTAGYLLYAAVTQKVTVTYTVKLTKSNNNISLFCSTSLTTRLVTSLLV